MCAEKMEASSSIFLRQLDHELSTGPGLALPGDAQIFSRNLRATHRARPALVQQPHQLDLIKGHRNGLSLAHQTRGGGDKPCRADGNGFVEGNRAVQYDGDGS